MRDFTAFVCKKYRIQANLNWLSCIRSRTYTDSEGFDEFFHLLDEFRESKRQEREREAKRAAKAGRQQNAGGRKTERYGTED